MQNGYHWVKVRKKRNVEQIELDQLSTFLFVHSVEYPISASSRHSIGIYYCGRDSKKSIKCLIAILVGPTKIKPKPLEQGCAKTNLSYKCFSLILASSKTYYCNAVIQKTDDCVSVHDYRNAKKINACPSITSLQETMYDSTVCSHRCYWRTRLHLRENCTKLLKCSVPLAYVKLRISLKIKRKDKTWVSDQKSSSKSDLIFDEVLRSLDVSVTSCATCFYIYSFVPIIQPRSTHFCR